MSSAKRVLTQRYPQQQNMPAIVKLLPYLVSSFIPTSF